MKTAKARRDRIFRSGKPRIRPMVYDDIRWLWVAARRQDYDGNPEDFSRETEPLLAAADKLFMLEDSNREFTEGVGPVGVVLANYDGWTLAPHVEWFPWATPRNILRCSVGFLQLMKYTHDVGCVKIFATAENAPWFKRLKRYIAINLGGRIPGGRPSGEEYIFYLRGRKQNERGNRKHLRRVETEVARTDIGSPATAGDNA